MVGINPEDNTVTVGTKEDLKEIEMIVRDVNLVKYDTIPDGMYDYKIRYKHLEAESVLSNYNGDVKVLFHNKVERLHQVSQQIVFMREMML